MYYELCARNQKKAEGLREEISACTLWVPFVWGKLCSAKKAQRHKAIFQRGTESSEESSGDDTWSSNFSRLNQDSVDLVLDAGVKSYSCRDFSYDDDTSYSSFNHPSLVSRALTRLPSNYFVS